MSFPCNLLSACSFVCICGTTRANNAAQCQRCPSKGTKLSGSVCESYLPFRWLGQKIKTLNIFSSNFERNKSQGTSESFKFPLKSFVQFIFVQRIIHSLSLISSNLLSSFPILHYCSFLIHCRFLQGQAASESPTTPSCTDISGWCLCKCFATSVWLCGSSGTSRKPAAWWAIGSDV